MRRLVIALALIAVTACGGDDPSATDVTSPGVSGSPRPTGRAEVSVATADPTRAPADPTVAPTPAPTPTVRPSDLANARIKTTKVADLSQPIALAQRPNDNTLYVAEQGGRVRAVGGGTVLDISSEVTNSGEQGLLGLAFNPAGTKMYVYFTNRQPKQVIREYSFSDGRASGPRDVLVMDDPYPNHNGGHLAFGPDGRLYAGTGDGGSGGDPQNNGQNVNSLLGKILRFDAGVTRPEIWAYGLRNPWRYSFDKATGDMWIADVGQNAWEEVNFQRFGTDPGRNYGWKLREGTHEFSGAKPAGAIDPVYEYSHEDGNCSVTGGYVYRGSRIQDLHGAYLFADYCVGRLRAFALRDGRATGHRFLGPRVANLTSFGQSHDGTLYAMSADGGLYRIDPA